MKRTNSIKKCIFSCILAFVILVTAFVLILVTTDDLILGVEPTATVDVESAVAVDKYWVCIDEEDVVISYGPTQLGASDDNGLVIEQGSEVSVVMDIETEGEYCLALEYQTVGQTIVQSTVSVDVDGMAIQSYINGVWCDESKEYILDRNDNEVVPEQVKLDTYVTDYVRDCSTLNLEPVTYKLSAGEHQITIDCTDQTMILRKLMLVHMQEPKSYEEYIKNWDGTTAEEPIIIEGEDYLAKSDSYVRSKSDINSSCAPYSPTDKLLNAIDYYSYSTAGQRVYWNFMVEEEGWYNIAFHYTQSTKEGMQVYRDIEIDGKCLFEELKEVGFNYTGSEYANHIVSVDGENARIYLTAGEHTISLFTNAPSLAPSIEEIYAIMDELSDIGLELQKVAGNNADVNRTWDIETYIPGVVERLTELQNRMTALYQNIQKQSGSSAASCVNLKMAAGIIEQVLERPDKLPAYVEQISVGSGSATDLLAQLINTLNGQGLSLDRIYLYGDNYELPRGNAGFFRSFVNGSKRFIDSLFNRSGSYGVEETNDTDENTITVWVNRPIAYVETLQLLADSRFTPEKGITVNFSVMPDEGKLILANASDSCPDVALGTSGDRPYQLGARGAALDLTQFDDFAEFVEENFCMEDMEPFVYDGSIYGMPETKQFYVLMYRTDIVEKLNLSIPETWNDVAELMPKLRRSGMNFYLPLSSATGTKPLSTIAPFFLQADAGLYSEDGMSTALNSENGITAFTDLTNLYTLYSLQNNMPSFYNNFRYGVTPMGVADFTTYVQMLYAAPEIADKWEIELAPGTLDEEGNINRQQVSLDRSCLILGSTKKEDQSWEFMKWWLSADTQTEFANTLQTKYGSEYVWNSANAEAFEQLSFPAKDREVILKSWEEAENYRTMPATYMLERALSNAWYQVVEEHESARVALNEAVFTIDQETLIRMQQFGYLDESGNVIEEYDMRSAEEIIEDLKGSGE